jgi:hypothetical protein
MTCDFVCLVLQAVGGAITSTSAGFSDEAKAMRQTGVDIMISGLSFQVLSLFAFMLYASIYSWRWHFATILRARRCMSSARVSLWWRGMVIGRFTREAQVFLLVTQRC